MTIQLKDGVYLDLPFEEYIEQDALGSSRKSTLWLRQEGYYWKYLSPYRAMRKSMPEQMFGSALHAMLLEGPSAYEARFCIKPDSSEYPDALTNIDDVKKALREEKIHVSPQPKNAEEWYDVAELYLPDRPVWANLMADFKRRQGNRTPISAEDDFAIRAMRSIATADTPDNAEVRELLSVGSQFPILAEVSVIYTDSDGLRHSARFDKMLPTSTIDLKSLGNWEGRELRASIHRHIVQHGYEIQAADYVIARERAFEMVLADPTCLHGGTEEERVHFLAMAQWCQTQPKAMWCWLWFQKPTAGGNAPVLLPVREEHGGPYHRAGFRKRHMALETYKRCMAQFGPDRPWGRVEPIHSTNEDAARGDPYILMESWGWGPDDPVPGEEEAMRK